MIFPLMEWSTAVTWRDERLTAELSLALPSVKLHVLKEGLFWQFCKL